jgi:hypothetical protein
MEAVHEAVAMHRLDHEAPGRAQDAADLGQRLDVLLVAVEAERREEVQGGVEALVRERQLAIVRLDELGGLVAGPPPGLGEERRRAIDARHAVARRASGMAWRPYRRARRAGPARGAGREPRGALRVGARIGVRLVVGEGAQVDSR